MLHSMLHSPAAYSTNIEDFTSRVMARLGWGDVSIAADLKASARRLMWQVSASGPLTNILPPLTWIPDILSPWARAEKKRHDKTRAWYIERMRDVQRRMEAKTAPESFMRSYFESKGSYKWDSDAEGAGAVGMIATAGIFTVGSPLHTFLLAMVLHPLWLKKVQDEIDAVCGGERAPEMADYARLPLLRAVVKEVLRWRPAAPLGKLLCFLWVGE
jgi:cytochrome P450